MQTTEEPTPVSSKLREQFTDYWKRNIGQLVGWNGDGKAPDRSTAMLHYRIWLLYRIAATQEGVIE